MRNVFTVASGRSIPGGLATDLVTKATGRGSYDDFHFVDSGLCKCSSLVGVVWEVWNGLSFDPI